MRRIDGISKTMFERLLRRVVEGFFNVDAKMLLRGDVEDFFDAEYTFDMFFFRKI